MKMAVNMGPMGGPNGQMGPPGNIMQQYQSWRTNSPTDGYAGYSTQYNAQGSGAPPGVSQQQQIPPPGSSYNVQPTAATQGYGSYDNSNDEKKCLKPDDLRQAFMPTLRTLCGLLESGPFQKPMEPQALPPNYPTIVKKPMDLSTIENKLLTDQYTDPWEYVDDVWLMFDNAWLYYKKTSQIYKYCTKLSEVFNEEINSVMQTLGYCCGRKYTFNPEVLRCYGKQLCTIPSSAEYYSYQNQN
ncbi:histone acetyltransferase p300-like, partial [Temnothorax nylanderi]|uniref:histone acetyltransferase p300-like n=1 Tax=Temnothorax nylanderi TaxID=102681 RepID=UPI003A86AEB4